MLKTKYKTFTTFEFVYKILSTMQNDSGLAGDEEQNSKANTKQIIYETINVWTLQNDSGPAGDQEQSSHDTQSLVQVSP